MRARVSSRVCIRNGAATASAALALNQRVPSVFAAAKLFWIARGTERWRSYNSRRTTTLCMIGKRPVRPHRRRLGVGGAAHAAAGEVGRALDAGVRVHEDVAVAKRPGGKDGHAHEAVVAAAEQHGVGGERELGDVELGVASLPPK